MTDRDPERKTDRAKPAQGAGVGVAVGVGIGAAMYAATGEVYWLGVGSGVGLAVGATASRRSD